MPYMGIITVLQFLLTEQLNQLRYSTTATGAASTNNNKISTNSWDPKVKYPPRGFNELAPVLSAIENVLRDKVRKSNAGKRNTESMWPVHQIIWQCS